MSCVEGAAAAAEASGQNKLLPGMKSAQTFAVACFSNFGNNLIPSPPATLPPPTSHRISAPRSSPIHCAAVFRRQETMRIRRISPRVERQNTGRPSDSLRSRMPAYRVGGWMVGWLAGWLANLLARRKTNSKEQSAS